MAYHDDLFDQAAHLTSKERWRPKQASLRRGISNAYYGLFHALTADAMRMVSRRARGPLGRLVRRAVQHAALRETARAFSTATSRTFRQHPWLDSLGRPPSEHARDVARAFIELQTLRHAADYDLGHTFTRSEARVAIRTARVAVAKWRRAARSIDGEAFLLAALLRTRI